MSATATLACAMDACAAAVTHIDDRGFVYCDAHGIVRQRHGRCRKLTPGEGAALRRGETIRYERARRRS